MRMNHGELLMHHRYGGAGTPITCGVTHGCITAVVEDVHCPDCLAALRAETVALNAEWKRVDPEGVAALRRSAARLSNFSPEQLRADIGRWTREIQNERTRRGLTDEHPNIAQRLARIRVAEKLLEPDTGSSTSGEEANRD